MQTRAPDSKPLQPATLPDHALVFESNEPEGKHEAYFANVSAEADASVPGALYDISPRDLVALDVYEDVARGVYAREILSVVCADGTRAEAIVYRMNAARSGRFGAPSGAQLDQIRAGYADWDLDLRVLDGALDSIKSRMA